MGRKKIDPASRPDKDQPKLKRPRKAASAAPPAPETIAGTSDPTPPEPVRRGVGRPSKPDKKINQTLRLDPDVVAAYRQQGRGWQAHMNEVLREHMPRLAKS